MSTVVTMKEKTLNSYVAVSNTCRTAGTCVRAYIETICLFFFDLMAEVVNNHRSPPRRSGAAMGARSGQRAAGGGCCYDRVGAHTSAGNSHFLPGLPREAGVQLGTKSAFICRAAAAAGHGGDVTGGRPRGKRQTHPEPRTDGGDGPVQS